MITIKDSVHNHIDVDGVGAALLDSAPIQRLRYIRQLGTVHLVYPSANHTRFEHSLGVYYLSRRAIDHLGITDRPARTLAAAALLHDVGHTPFSHTLEPILDEETGRTHDDIAHLMGDPPIGPILRENDVDPLDVAALIEGQGRLGQLLSGELDVDRMDYLVRDAHHTGVPYGTIDPGRLLRELTFVDGTLALQEGNVQSAENLLIARSLMNPTVYNHHVSRITKAMLRRALEQLVEEDVLEELLRPIVKPWTLKGEPRAHPLRQATDRDVLRALSNHPQTEQTVRRLLSRNLFKRAVWAERSHVPDDLISCSAMECRQFERAIADRVGIDATEVLVDVPLDHAMTEAASQVIVNGEPRRLDQQSPLVQALQSSHRSRWRLGVYAPTSHLASVANAAVSELGLDLSAPYVRERTDPSNMNLQEFIDQ